MDCVHSIERPIVPLILSTCRPLLPCTTYKTYPHHRPLIYESIPCWYARWSFAHLDSSAPFPEASRPPPHQRFSVQNALVRHESNQCLTTPRHPGPSFPLGRRRRRRVVTSAAGTNNDGVYTFPQIHVSVGVLGGSVERGCL